jgi:hypothetical protein
MSGCGFVVRIMYSFSFDLIDVNTVSCLTVMAVGGQSLYILLLIFTRNILKCKTSPGLLDCPQQ